MRTISRLVDESAMIGHRYRGTRELAWCDGALIQRFTSDIQGVRDVWAKVPHVRVLDGKKDCTVDVCNHCGGPLGDVRTIVETWNPYSKLTFCTSCAKQRRAAESCSDAPMIPGKTLVCGVCGWRENTKGGCDGDHCPRARCPGIMRRVGDVGSSGAGTIYTGGPAPRTMYEATDAAKREQRSGSIDENSPLAYGTFEGAYAMPASEYCTVMLSRVKHSDTAALNRGDRVEIRNAKG